MSPPQTQFNREDVLNAAFEVAQQEGLKELSARKIADRLGSSTAPVYSSFNSMAMLEREVIIKARDLLIEYTRGDYTEHIFLNMGLGLAIFSREQKPLFRALFLEETEYQEIIEEFGERMQEQMGLDDSYGHLTEEVRQHLLHKMWIFTHGLASLICVGLTHDDSNEFIENILREVGAEIIAATFLKAQGDFQPQDEKVKM